MKTFIAHFRYRINKSVLRPYGELMDTYVEIKTTSQQDAKTTAKNMIGQEDKTWLISVYRKQEATT